MARNPYGSSTGGYRAPGALAVIALLATLALAVVVGYGVTAGGGLSVDAAVGTLGPLVHPAYGLALAGVLATTALFAGLYAHTRERVPTGAAVAFAFVPVYSVLGLVAFGGGLVALELAAVRDVPVIDPAAALLPGLLPQSAPWTGRALATAVAITHAVLALPALGFGLVLALEWRAGLGGAGRLVAGVGLVLAGLAWLVGPGRVAVPGLGYATTAGTALYGLALIALAVDFLR